MSDYLDAIFGKAKYVRIMLVDGDWVVDEIDNLNESSPWIDITEMVDDEDYDMKTLCELFVLEPAIDPEEPEQ